MEPLKSTGKASFLLDDLKNVQSIPALKQARMQKQEELQDLTAIVSLIEWYQMVNDLHDYIARQVIEICENEMEVEGYGRRPVPYAFVVFGSSGRGEATLWSDQDNGMIISDLPHPGKEAYFEELGKRISDSLEAVGYAKCEGKVMCSEPLWRRTLASWKQQLADWTDDLKWEPVRYLIIAADLRYVGGDRTLSEDFRSHFSQLFQSTPDLASAVLRNTVKHKATLNILGRVVTERFGEHAGGFDIKYGMYIPLVNSARYMALLNGLKDTNTIKRLTKLARLEAVPLHSVDACEDAFKIALKLRRVTEVENENGIISSSGYIGEEQLKQRTILYELREGLSTVKKVHRNLQRQLRFVERRRS